MLQVKIYFMLQVKIFFDVASEFMLQVKAHSVGGLRGRDRMVVGFTTTYAVSAYHH